MCVFFFLGDGVDNSVLILSILLLLFPLLSLVFSAVSGGQDFVSWW